MGPGNSKEKVLQSEACGTWTVARLPSPGTGLLQLAWRLDRFQLIPSNSASLLLKSPRNVCVNQRFVMSLGGLPRPDPCGCIEPRWEKEAKRVQRVQAEFPASAVLLDSSQRPVDSVCQGRFSWFFKWKEVSVSVGLIGEGSGLWVFFLSSLCGYNSDECGCTHHQGASAMAGENSWHTLIQLFNSEPSSYFLCICSVLRIGERSHFPLYSTIFIDT